MSRLFVHAVAVLRLSFEDNGKAHNDLVLSLDQFGACQAV
jgi:hypothetical protein